MLDRLAGAGRVAIFDPDGVIDAFDTFYSLDGVETAGFYVQNVENMRRRFDGHAARPVTELTDCDCDAIFIASFDHERALRRLGTLLPPGVALFGFDSLKLPPQCLSNSRRYLDTLNFATNFAFFRDAGGHHTQLVTANYWTRYGAKDVSIWCRLFDAAGAALATWTVPCPDPEGSIVIDSAEVRARFGLPPFVGQLFVHVVGAAGHDIVKYALDTYGDNSDMLSHTHDANSWPSDLYAGLPAPDDGEDVVLWVQNSHPSPIAAGEIGLGLMGGGRKTYLMEEIAPFGTRRLSIAELLPGARWPQQIEIDAGKHMVRPRYEVTSANGRTRISHANVERSDLKPEPALRDLAAWFGKGFILPAPVLPPDRYQTLVLPTPMSTAQTHLPVKALVYDPSGMLVGESRFGNLGRGESVALDLATLGGNRPEGGHVELVYDFEAGEVADGWLHALFRYRDKKSGHAAETSFGAHIFNSPLTWRGEPQSYAGPPPGLSTRLFLRVAGAPLDTVCHLAYPVSKEWRPYSLTVLILVSGEGREIARKEVRVPASGSLLWRVREMFDAAALKAAGPQAYVIIRDETCRLFGYEGIFAEDGGFGFDHMFGF